MMSHQGTGRRGARVHVKQAAQASLPARTVTVQIVLPCTCQSKQYCASCGSDRGRCKGGVGTVVLTLSPQSVGGQLRSRGTCAYSCVICRPMRLVTASNGENDLKNVACHLYFGWYKTELSISYCGSVYWSLEGTPRAHVDAHVGRRHLDDLGADALQPETLGRLVASRQHHPEELDSPVTPAHGEVEVLDLARWVVLERRAHLDHLDGSEHVAGLQSQFELITWPPQANTQLATTPTFISSMNARTFASSSSDGRGRWMTRIGTTWTGALSSRANTDDVGRSSVPGAAASPLGWVASPVDWAGWAVASRLG